MKRYQTLNEGVSAKNFEEPVIVNSFSGKEAISKAIKHDDEWESVIYVKDDINKTLSFHMLGNDSDLYDILKRKRAYRGKVFNTWQDPLRYINFDEYEVEAFDYRKNLPKIVPVSIVWDKYNSNSSFYGGLEETHHLWDTTQKNIMKFGKGKVKDVQDYHYEWTSRGGWAMYIAKSLDPNDLAVLVAYDDNFFTSKK